MSTRIIKGKYNTVEMVDPEQCHFIAMYPGGRTVQGKNLIDTGWAELEDGIEKLSYKLSNGIFIELPKFEAYLHLVEVSQTLETGDMIYHSVNIKGKLGEDIINYNIALKQDKLSPRKIGDIKITKEAKALNNKYWKKSA